MPNAFFYYVFPLIISIGFVAAGFSLFKRYARGDRDGKGGKYGADAGCGGMLFMVVGSTIGLAILLTSPMPCTRQRIFDHVFRTPPQQIVRFVIRRNPDANDSLVVSDIVVEDRKRIEQIADALRNGREIWPNHPTQRWSARVEMITRDGTYYFGVSAPQPGDRNGTLVGAQSSASDRGWNLGDVRADGLDKIFEEIVRETKPKR